jgi:hypothetical protein
MERDHPHAGATYQVVAREDGGFGVEVTIPNSHPTMVTGFATEAAAEAWIARHKEGVTNSTSLRRKTFYPQKR